MATTHLTQRVPVREIRGILAEQHYAEVSTAPVKESDE
jgi:hypothetical protein